MAKMPASLIKAAQRQPMPQAKAARPANFNAPPVMPAPKLVKTIPGAQPKPEPPSPGHVAPVPGSFKEPNTNPPPSPMKE